MRHRLRTCLGLLSVLLSGLLPLALVGGLPARGVSGAGGGPPGRAGAGGADPVELCFVTVGCNRVDRKDWSRSCGNPSSANRPQLLQTFTDVAALDPAPSHFFFTGDMVLGDVKDDGGTLKGQLDAWSALTRAHPLSRHITLVPLPGNHEMLAYDPGLGDRICLPEAGQVWDRWMRDRGYGLAHNGPRASGANPDHLMGDERRLTWSCNVGGTHFLLLNTDTWTREGTVGAVALHWIARDLEAAQADPAVRHIFVLGHKPVLPAAGTLPKPDKGDDRAIAVPFQEPMVRLLAGTPKVRAYLCAHAHLFEASRLGGPGGPWQVIAGNGGSSLESTWHPEGGTWFGFVVVKVHASGLVTATPHARPAADPGQALPAIPRAAWTLAPPR